MLPKKYKRGHWNVKDYVLPWTYTLFGPHSLTPVLNMNNYKLPLIAVKRKIKILPVQSGF
jgi:hypothetical protein